MQQDGVRDQVTQVRGYADQFLRVKINPYDPSNRRISILVKNGSDGSAPPLGSAKDVASRSATGPDAKPGAAQSAAPQGHRRRHRRKPAAGAPAASAGVDGTIEGHDAGDEGVDVWCTLVRD